MSDPIKIKIKRGLTSGVEPAGLTYGELAVNIADKKMFIGGVTGETVLLFTGITGGVENAPQQNFAAGDSVVNIQPYSPTGLVPFVVEGGFWFNSDTGMLYTGVLGASNGLAWVQSTILNNPSNFN
jgi:hypothetical protein